jgi:hypothetical protein
MIQAQQTHPSTIRSGTSLAVAALLASALVGLAVVVTQVTPLRIDTNAPARSYAVDAANAWEAQRDAISVATFPDSATAAERAWESLQAQISTATYDESSSYRPGVLRRQAAADSADEPTRGSSRAPIAR